MSNQNPLYPLYPLYPGGAQRMRDEAEKARQAAQYQSLVNAQRQAGIKDSKSRSMIAKLFGGV